MRYRSCDTYKRRYGRSRSTNVSLNTVLLSSYLALSHYVHSSCSDIDELPCRNQNRALRGSIVGAPRVPDDGEAATWVKSSRTRARTHRPRSSGHQVSPSTARGRSKGKSCLLETRSDSQASPCDLRCVRTPMHPARPVPSVPLATPSASEKSESRNERAMRATADLRRANEDKYMRDREREKNEVSHPLFPACRPVGCWHT